MDSEAELTERKAQLDALEECVEQVQGDLATAQQKNAELSTISEELAQKEVELTQLQAELDDTKASNVEVQDKLRSEIAELKIWISNLRMIIDNKNRELEALAQSVDEKKEEREARVANCVQTLSLELQRIKEHSMEFSRAQNQIAQEQAVKEKSLQAELTKARAASVEIQAKMNWNKIVSDKAKNHLHELVANRDNQVDHLRQAGSDLENELKQCNTLIGNLEADLYSTRQRHARYLAQSQELAAQHKMDIKALQTQLKDAKTNSIEVREKLETQNTALKKSVSDLQQVIENKSAELAQIEDQKSIIEGKLVEIKAEMHQQHAAAAQVKDEILYLKLDLKDAQISKVETQNSLTSENARLTAENEQLQATAIKLQKVLDQKSVELDKLRSQILDQNVAAAKALATSEHELVAITGQMEVKLQEYTNAQEVIAEKQAALSASSSQIQQLLQKCADLEQKLVEHSERASELETELHNTQNENAQLQADAVEYETKIQDLTLSLSSSSAELKHTLVQLNEQAQENQALVTELDEVAAFNDYQMHMNDEQQLALQQLQVRNQVLEEEVTLFEKEDMESQLLEGYATLGDAVLQVKALSHQLDLKQRELELTQAELSRLQTREEPIVCDAEVQTQWTADSSDQKQNAQLRTAYTELVNEVERLNNEKTSLEEKLANAQELATSLQKFVEGKELSGEHQMQHPTYKETFTAVSLSRELSKTQKNLEENVESQLSQESAQMSIEDQATSVSEASVLTEKQQSLEHDMRQSVKQLDVSLVNMPSDREELAILQAELDQNQQMLEAVQRTCTFKDDQIAELKHAMKKSEALKGRYEKLKVRNVELERLCDQYMEEIEENCQNIRSLQNKLARSKTKSKIPKSVIVKHKHAARVPPPKSKLPKSVVVKHKHAARVPPPPRRTSKGKTASLIPAPKIATKTGIVPPPPPRKGTSQRGVFDFDVELQKYARRCVEAEAQIKSLEAQLKKSMEAHLTISLAKKQTQSHGAQVGKAGSTLDEEKKQQEQAISQRDEQIQALETSLENAQQQSKQMQEQVHTLEESSSNKSQTIKDINAQLESMDSQLKAVKLSVSRKQFTLVTKDAAIKAQQKQLAQLRSKLTESTQQLVELQQHFESSTPDEANVSVVSVESTSSQASLESVTSVMSEPIRSSRPASVVTRRYESKTQMMSPLNGQPQVTILNSSPTASLSGTTTIITTPVVDRSFAFMSSSPSHGVQGIGEFSTELKQAQHDALLQAQLNHFNFNAEDSQIILKLLQTWMEDNDVIKAKYIYHLEQEVKCKQSEIEDLSFSKEVLVGQAQAEAQKLKEALEEAREEVCNLKYTVFVYDQIQMLSA